MWWDLVKIREVFWGRRIKITKIFFSLHFKGFKRFLWASVGEISVILAFYDSELTPPRSNLLGFLILNQFEYFNWLKKSPETLLNPISFEYSNKIPSTSAQLSNKPTSNPIQQLIRTIKP